MVLLEPTTPRGQWPLAVVEHAYPGCDGRAQVVQVRSGSRTYTRAITSVCPLEDARESGDLRFSTGGE